MHEIITSTNARLVGCFQTLDARGASADFGLTYGMNKRDLYLLVSTSAPGNPMIDVQLPLADVRALRDFLNGLDLTDPAPSREFKRLREMATAARDAVRYAMFPAKPPPRKRKPRKKA